MSEANEPAGDDATAAAEPPPESNRGRWFRLGLLAALTVAAILALRSTGMSGAEMIERTRSAMASAGIGGFLLFVVLFALGELMHVPGLVFIAAAVFAYEPTLGAVAGYTGAVASVSIAFAVVRGAGGQALKTVDKPWLQRWLKRLEARPVRVVFLLRTLLWMAPILNYALAMAPLRFRDYFIGSALGLVMPVILAVTFLDKVMEWFL
ncbi:MAG: VTT domain-containing protein [Myxococcota bacterium]